MYRAGQREIDAIAKVINSGKLFRYGADCECGRFEKRYAEMLGVKYVCMTSSGSTALAAALAGLEIGPGDEVLVPACTYMATAIAVLAVGAIPVIVDIDESITIDPQAIDEAVGPCTRAVIPVHMWGLTCDMDAVMQVARKHNLLVVEDACQAVGGGYKGRMLGAIGDAAGFSFNYYKNMTCGEGGAVVTSNEHVYERAKCYTDCCGFYWNGRESGVKPFASAGARASELEGAMLNAQLDQIGEMIDAMRQQKTRILSETADTGLQPAPVHSLDHECGTHVMWQLPTEGQADAFIAKVRGMICGKTGRHVYTEWDQIFAHEGAHHPALNPYNLPANQKCRTEYTKDMCARSLDILNRTVAVSTHPDRTDDDVTAQIERVKAGAAAVL
jgi:dTDP-4-amino-4,6-dideoxygalactose transaminase